MNKILINLSILIAVETAYSQTPPVLPAVKPVFYGLPRFDESPTNGPTWNFNDNPNNSESTTFYTDSVEYVTTNGPSIKSARVLGPYEFSRLSINPREHIQNGTNIFHNLTFYYRWYNIGWTDVGLRVNGVFFCRLPAVNNWTKFSTNVNIGIVNKVSWEIDNPTSGTYRSTFQVDAVQWHPLYTFSENNQTNFIISTTGLKSNVKWNANVYPAGTQGFKLYSSTNLINFSLVTNSPILTNGFFTVSLTKVNNEFYQLRVP